MNFKLKLNDHQRHGCHHPCQLSLHVCLHVCLRMTAVMLKVHMNWNGLRQPCRLASKRRKEYWREEARLPPSFPALFCICGYALCIVASIAMMHLVGMDCGNRAGLPQSCRRCRRAEARLPPSFLALCAIVVILSVSGSLSQ